MPHLIIEIKARCPHPELVRKVLQDRHADFRGLDHQCDTYFKVPQGRLKLRQGNIENSLIFYQRPNQPGPKSSNVSLCTLPPDCAIKEVLLNVHDVLVVVDKQREIYFIQNIKFHIDTVRDLGDFVEIEAIDTTGKIPPQQLQHQCQTYIDLFQIDPNHLVDRSYSDMLLEGK